MVECLLRRLHSRILSWKSGCAEMALADDLCCWKAFRKVPCLARMHGPLWTHMPMLSDLRNAQREIIYGGKQTGYPLIPTRKRSTYSTALCILARLSKCSVACLTRSYSCMRRRAMWLWKADGAYKRSCDHGGSSPQRNSSICIKHKYFRSWKVRHMACTTLLHRSSSAWTGSNGDCCENSSFLN